MPFMAIGDSLHGPNSEAFKITGSLRQGAFGEVHGSRGDLRNGVRGKASPSHVAALRELEDGVIE